ncbi:MULTISPECIES: site-specific integrase [unclassified Streptomyces]|uniref:tyrosine-type recombinase/integrase n=1 Tax=unclassified Streptomyces TaxID=2593676 RepID=UPI000DBA291C|nr:MULTISPECIES: site-specific integrase [unclassified Streptomyces]MYT71349.1 tyrosine-type recombinase/integrase [Streptomyces sp. SID8367]RAJ82804.1 phage integrase family protein [Streptomyces sp. PsTaAH-137]
METTYDVKVYKILPYKGARKTTYTVRWMVAGKAWREPFSTVALAEGFRSELIQATSKGEGFVIATGLPVSHRSKAASMSWYTFAIQYVDARWPQLGGNSRKNTAKTLTAITIALLRARPAQFDPVAVRTALREWAFNVNRRPDAPRDVVIILRWIERNSLPVSSWEDPEKVDEVLRAIDTRLDGKQAAAWSRKRHRRILNVVMKHAIRRRILRANPLPKGKEATTTTKTTNAVDKRCLINPAQAAALLDWVRQRPRGGKRLHAFFAALYYCGPRPEEAVAMRVADVKLPDVDANDQWCELLIHTATPEVGKQWTDTGEIHEERDLKGRAEGETRTVPGHPALTRILRQHIEDEELKPGDLLFRGEKTGVLAGSVFRRAWRSAREAVLPPHVFESPMGKRVYDLRHTRLTKWLNDGIPPAQVADWAGNSVPVLLSIYARCVDGQLPDLKRRLEAAGDLEDLTDTD